MSVARDELLEGLSEDTKDFWVDASIPVLHNPTAAQFLREAVCRYHPVLITGLIDHWPALEKWNKDYLVQVIGDRKVNINLAPDGHGDCVKNIYSAGGDATTEPKPFFVYPAEHDMTMSDFFKLLQSDGTRSAVPYLSQQNDNLRQNMPELLRDIQTTLPLATEAFGSNSNPLGLQVEEDEYGVVSGALEAVNLWIGDERSVSSIHKDHYENMYAVVSGEKTFTLLPPTDVAFLAPYTREYPTLRYAVRGADSIVHSAEPSTEGTQLHQEESAQYRYFDTAREAAQYAHNAQSIDTHSTALQLELIKNGCPSKTLEWTPLDPEDPEVSNKYPLFRRATPLRVKVLPGQVLYIPAMWYHRVSQTCLTVSVNYWYDQKFDFR